MEQNQNQTEQPAETQEQQQPVEKSITRNQIKNWADALKAVMPQMGELIEDNKRLKIELGFATTAIRGNKYLQQCDPKTIYDALMKCTRIGLSLNPALQFSYLVPRKVNGNWTCVYEVGYRGWSAMLRSEGAVKYIDAHIVYEDEVFEYNPAENTLKHVPSFAKSEAEHKQREIKCGYSVATLMDGTMVYEVIPAWELMKIKNVSSSVKSGSFSPHTDWEHEMLRKAPLKRHAKKLTVTQSSQRLQEMFYNERSNDTQSDGVKKPKTTRWDGVEDAEVLND